MEFPLQLDCAAVIVLLCKAFQCSSLDGGLCCSSHATTSESLLLDSSYLWWCRFLPNFFPINYKKRMDETRCILFMRVQLRAWSSNYLWELQSFGSTPLLEHQIWMFSVGTNTIGSNCPPIELSREVGAAFLAMDLVFLAAEFSSPPLMIWTSKHRFTLQGPMQSVHSRQLIS